MALSLTENPFSFQRNRRCILNRIDVKYAIRSPSTIIRLAVLSHRFPSTVYSFD